MSDFSHVADFRMGLGCFDRFEAVKRLLTFCWVGRSYLRSLSFCGGRRCPVFLAVFGRLWHRGSTFAGLGMPPSASKATNVRNLAGPSFPLWSLPATLLTRSVLTWPSD